MVAADQGQAGQERSSDAGLAAAEHGSTVPSQTAPPVSGVQSAPTVPLPPGLTEGNDGGRKKFEELCAQEDAEFRRAFARELTRYWMSSGRTGPEEFPRDRVEKVYDLMTAYRRDLIVRGERPKIRAEVHAQLHAEMHARIAELDRDHANEIREMEHRREIESAVRRAEWRHASVRWAVGSALTTGTTATISVLALPDVSPWAKFALVTANVVGALACRPSGDSGE